MVSVFCSKLVPLLVCLAFLVERAVAAVFVFLLKVFGMPFLKSSIPHTPDISGVALVVVP